MTTVTETLIARMDTYVRSDRPNANFGDATTLSLNGGTITHNAFIYFPVDVAKLSGATILSATLRMYLRDDWPGGNLRIRRITSAWKEGKVTYNTEPSTSSTGEITVTPSGSAGDPIEVDVKSFITIWVAGKPVYGLRLATGGTTARRLFSSEAPAAKRPTLTIVWKRLPGNPTNLRPRGGQAVDAAAPLLVWESDTPTQVQVQIDDADTFTSPVYDSGWVNSDETSFNTAISGSPPTLNDNTTYWWRVRIKDEDGLTSDWSEPAEFQRRTFGVVTVVAPASTVNETTPTVSHTFTGRTQTAVEYVLKEDGEVVYSRAKALTSATNFQLPAGYISAGPQYTVIVRVWDQFNRSGTEGRGYVNGSANFVFQRGSVTPVSNLSGTTEDGHVLLTWHRTTTPDYFAVEMDGRIILDRVEPSDVALGGGDFALKIYKVPPREVHTFAVAAVQDVNGVFEHSSNDPTVDVAFKPIGIWLLRPDTDEEVRILGQDAVDTVIGETGATFFALNRQDPVRITDQVRGLEGSVSGVLANGQGRYAAVERDTLLSIRRDPTAVLRLVWGRRNIPVVIGDVSVDESPTPEERYAVSFSFWQVDEFEVKV